MKVGVIPEALREASAKGSVIGETLFVESMEQRKMYVMVFWWPCVGTMVRWYDGMMVYYDDVILFTLETRHLQDIFTGSTPEEI